MDRPNVPSPADEERSLRAAELALRLVQGENRDEVLRRDPALAREVARWEDDLARFSDELTPLPPSPLAWERLDAAVAQDAARAALPQSVPAARWRNRLGSLWLWRGLAGGAAAAAATFAVLLMRAPDIAPIPPSPSITRVLLVSALLPRDGAPLYVATYDAARATVVAVPAVTGPSPGRVPQLWLVPKDNGEPIALGALDPEQPVAVALTPQAARLADADAGLVITLEPAGVPIGPAAQGPVIAHGRFTAL